MDFAYNTGSWLVVSNRYGVERFADFQGGPCIISPNRVVYFEGLQMGEDCIVSKVLEDNE